MNKFFSWKTILVVSILAMVVAAVVFIPKAPKRFVSSDILKSTWVGYKKYFIEEDGRVKRPKENDTVSEGQAYAMLRAVWMDDKETFDRCYRWSEGNLSRTLMNQGHLLGWHWKNGHVDDWMPASDADIDYALSLILAQAKWEAGAPDGLEGYGSKAQKILSDVLTHLTYTTDSGRLYLSPWMTPKAPRSLSFPVNIFEQSLIIPALAP